MKKSLLKTVALFGGIFVFIGILATSFPSSISFAVVDGGGYEDGLLRDSDNDSYNEEDVVNIPEPDVGSRLPRRNLNTIIWALQRLYQNVTTECPTGYVMKGFKLDGSLACADETGATVDVVVPTGATLGLNLVNTQVGDSDINTLISTLKTLYSAMRNRCPDGQVMSGFNSSGALVCRTPQGGSISTKPTAPAIINIVPGNESVSLSWNTPSNGGEVITGYKVKHSTDQASWNTAMDWNLTNSFTDTGLTNGTTYYYQVQAQNIKGPSDWSATASATPVAAPNPCNLPWGGTLAHGASTVAYQTQTHPVNCDNIKEIRVCNDGSLTGSYQYQSCTVDGGGVPDCSCATNTCIGSTCDDGVGGTCDGTKDCSGGGPICGDGNVDEAEGEQCDDGNTNNNDGCSSLCAWETRSFDCELPPETEGAWQWNGNSALNQTCESSDGTQCASWIPVLPDTLHSATSDTCHYECSVGYSWNGTNCEEDAPPPACGNGSLNAGEQCDDGNTNNGDGCSATCQWDQRNFSCNNTLPANSLWNTVSNYTQTCTSSNGSSCTNWSPASDTSTEYNETATTNSCQFKCENYHTYFDGPSECILNTCGGTTPTNATLCSGDSIRIPTTGVTKTLVSSCGTPKCEYTCNAGYTLYNDTCAKEPDAPSLNASAGNRSVNLQWNIPANNGAPITGFTLERATAIVAQSDSWLKNFFASLVGVVDQGSYSEISTFGATTTTYTDTGLTNGTNYTYRIKATNAIGDSSWSNTRSAVPETLTAPRNLTATGGDGQVSLTWSSPADDGGYPVINYTIEKRLEIATGEGSVALDLKALQASLVAFEAGIYTEIGNTSSTSYTDTSVSNGQTYTYRVYANTSKPATSAASLPASATPAGVPYAPGNFSATAGRGEINLSWSTPSGNGSPVTSYTLQRQYEDKASSTALLPRLTANLVGVTSWVTINSNLIGNSYTDTNVVTSRDYTYRIAAKNAVGTGSYATSNRTSPLATTKTWTCPTPANHALSSRGTSWNWNTVGSYSQTWTDGYWSPPDDNTTSYTSVVGSTTDCRFTCLDGYHYESGICIVDQPDPICGDGETNQVSEQCDDGNLNNGDGCSSTCQWETRTYTCPSKPTTGTSWNTVSSYNQTCTASNGSSCTTWNPITDTTTDYNTTSSTTSCRYKCATGYYLSGGVCVPYECGGTIPSNSVLCAGDDTGLTGFSVRKLTSSCTAIQKCEYICGEGYHYDAGSCVQNDAFPWEVFTSCYQWTGAVKFGASGVTGCTAYKPDGTVYLPAGGADGTHSGGAWGTELGNYSFTCNKIGGGSYSVSLHVSNYNDSKDCTYGSANNSTE